MTRFKLILEYNGTNLIGFQKNLHGPSVQSLLQDAIFKFCGQAVEVIGAGRTDAGVHAIAMPVHVDIEKCGMWNVECGIKSAETVKRALNFYLMQMNAPISVLSCEVVSDDWHARFSCKKRHYKYVILNRPSRPVLNTNTWWIPRKLDVDAMRVGAEKFLGEHDWTSFRSSECQAKSPIKTLDEIRISNLGHEILIELSARSFLHHQVRNIVGTLVDIGLGKDLDIDKIFDAKNRSAAGITAPAAGLYFIKADY